MRCKIVCTSTFALMPHVVNSPCALQHSLGWITPQWHSGLQHFKEKQHFNSCPPGKTYPESLFPHVDFANIPLTHATVKSAVVMTNLLTRDVPHFEECVDVEAIASSSASAVEGMARQITATSSGRCPPQVRNTPCNFNSQCQSNYCQIAFTSTNPKSPRSVQYGVTSYVGYCADEPMLGYSMDTDGKIRNYAMKYATTSTTTPQKQQKQQQYLHDDAPSFHNDDPTTSQAQAFYIHHKQWSTAHQNQNVVQYDKSVAQHILQHLRPSEAYQQLLLTIADKQDQHVMQALGMTAEQYDFATEHQDSLQNTQKQQQEDQSSSPSTLPSMSIVFIAFFTFITIFVF